ncbi:hypothetical protein [Streptomyces sp. NPDC004376]
MMTENSEWKPVLSASMVQWVLEVTRNDQLLCAATALLLFVGLRRDEVTGILVDDWLPGREACVTIRRRQRIRSICVAAPAAAAVDAHLAAAETEPNKPLLGLQANGKPYPLSRLFRERMEEAGLDVVASDLRRTAMAATLNHGIPISHVAAYFGLSKSVTVKQFVSTPEGFDREIAGFLGIAFAA